MRFLSSILVVLALVAAPVCAYAGEPSKPDAARAAELKKQGDELMHSSHFREALGAYEQAYAAVPNPAILYNRGNALQQLGDLPAALDMFEKFVADAPESLKSRVPNLSKTIEELAAQVATVAIECPVAGAAVVVRGKTAGTTPLGAPIRVVPGPATIDVTAPGYASFHRDATLTGGATATIKVELAKLAGPGAGQPSPGEAAPGEAAPGEVAPGEEPPAEASPAAAGRGWKIAAYGSGAVGIAGIGVGSILGGVALARKGDADAQCPLKVCSPAGRAALNDAGGMAGASTALFVVGAVGLAASVTLFLLRPRHAPAQARLIVGPGFSGIGGTW